MTAKPPVELEIGRTVPAWLLRIVIIAAGVAAMIILDAGPVAMVIIGTTLAVVAVRPLAATGAVCAGAVGFFWMIVPTPAFHPGQFALIALVHLIFVLAGCAAGLPLRTRVELAALRSPLLRYLIIDVISQLLLLGAQLLRLARPGGDDPAVGAIVLGCAVVLAIAAWLILPRLSRSD